MPVKHVVVLGSGTAGLLAALSLKTKLPDLQVTIVRSKEIGVIGVGEGTTAFMPAFLHGYLGIDLCDFFRAVHPTFKLGIRFVWGKRDHFHYTFSTQFALQPDGLSKPPGFYCGDDLDDLSVNSCLMARDLAFTRGPEGAPVNNKDVAYHLENATLVDYLDKLAVQRGVRIEEQTVTGAQQNETGITAVVCESGRTIAADLFVDCSGFSSTLLGGALGEPFIDFASSLFCDRAVIGGWDRTPADPLHPYTLVDTMDGGWSWRIDHEHRINRGYVYGSGFISDDDAEAEFRRKNPNVTQTRMLKFRSGRHVRSWVKNVVAIGNAFGFVEPLEATSLTLICDQCRSLAASLIESGRNPGPAIAAIFNVQHQRRWDGVRSFLAVHYKFNDRIDTPFWQACREKTDLAGAELLCELYEENGPSLFRMDYLVDSVNPFGADGYLSMLVGMKVPHRRPYAPTDRERQYWSRYLMDRRAMASNGVTVAEATAIIKHPGTRIQPGFYTLT